MTGSDRSGYLHELVPLLWPPPAAVTLGRARLRDADRSYLILPGLAEPRLLVPRRPRSATGAALLSQGERSSATRRAAVRAGSLALAGGAGDLMLHDRLEVRGDTIEDQLERDLGRDVVLSLRLGPARANRKPVLQLLDRRAATIGFAKVAITPLTVRLVASETAALGVLAAARLRHVTAPQVLAGGSWNGLEILVQSSLPVHRPRHPSPGRLMAAIREVAAVGGIHHPSVLDGPYLAGLRERVSALADEETASRLLRALNGLPRDVELPIGSWHGDWTPWNTAVLADTVLAWDWERFGHGVPVGFDALHYYVQPRVMGRPAAAAGCAADLVQRAPALLAPIGVPAAAAPSVAVLYLAEILARYGGDNQAKWPTWRAMSAAVELRLTAR